MRNQTIDKSSQINQSYTPLCHCEQTYKETVEVAESVTKIRFECQSLVYDKTFGYYTWIAFEVTIRSFLGSVVLYFVVWIFFGFALKDDCRQPINN